MRFLLEIEGHSFVEARFDWLGHHLRAGWAIAKIYFPVLVESVLLSNQHWGTARKIAEYLAWQSSRHKAFE